jgi:small nuclear ribonucleoprotein (snRNP)-like protein
MDNGIDLVGKDVVVWLRDGNKKFGVLTKIEGSFVYLKSNAGNVEIISSSYIDRIVLRRGNSGILGGENDNKR